MRQNLTSILKLGSTSILGLSLLTATITSCDPPQPKDQQRPNIILFLVDDMGWQDTSEPFWRDTTKFNRRYHTPNMEKLADQGVKFTQAYAMSICSPTRVSLMSGINAARHRVTNWTLRRNASNDAPHPDLDLPRWNVNGLQTSDSIEHSIHVTSLPQILSQNNYHTIHCGKGHFGAMNTPAANPSNIGFDVNIAGHAAGGPGSYLGKKNYSAKWRGGDPIWDVPHLEQYHGTETYLTEALTQAAIDSLQAPVNENQPFFLYMSHYAVHVPIEADDRFMDRYDTLDIDPTEKAYATMVEGMDKSLGDLMDYLEENNLTGNTIILFMSDNGGLSSWARGGEPYTHNKPLASGKGSAYEGGIRVPMMVKWPGKTDPGSVCDQYVIIEDFFPTILEMAGIEKYKTIQQTDGISFTELLKGKKEKYKKAHEERALYWHFPNKWGSTGPGIGTTSTIRKGDWKLIYWYQDQSFELFNIDKDIGEEYNLAGDFPDRLHELANNLGKYLRSVDAQRPISKETGQPVPWPDEAAQKNLTIPIKTQGK